MEERKRFGFSRSDLKIITMSLMLIDHSYNMLFPDLDILKILGRISFPIFCFLTVESFKYTSNVKKYMSRLFIFAIISEVPFNLLAGWKLIYPSAQNVMWTILIGVIVLSGFEKCRHLSEFKSTILVIIIAVMGLNIADTFNTDYGGAGVLQIIIFYIFCGKAIDNKIGQLVGIGYINSRLLYGRQMDLGFLGLSGIKFSRQIIAIGSLPFIWLYNGEKGISSKKFQYICYWFYPVHILILALIKYLVFS